MTQMMTTSAGSTRERISKKKTHIGRRSLKKRVSPKPRTCTQGRRAERGNCGRGGRASGQIVEDEGKRYQLCAVYYRALKKDSKIADIIAPPIRHTGAIFPPMQRMNPMPPPQFRDMSRTAPSGMNCFGCGSEEHMVRDCPPINSLLNEGQIRWDDRGRLIYPDGASIRRFGTENLLEAIHKSTPRANLVSLNVLGTYETEEESVEEYFDYYSSEMEEDEPEDECSYQRPRRAYTVERRASGILGRVKE